MYLGFDMEVTEMCAYDYCASGADVGLADGYKDVSAIDRNETLYAPKLAPPPSVCQSMALLKRLTRSSRCGTTFFSMKAVAVKLVS